ncbi:MAG: thiamine pyrophosphate-dependent enzyme [Candidatus Methanomethylicus sp.]|nr:thiamine pyrophosphate-dependent enzyme [Candidatus Methanomethylicus sp.]
MAKFRCTVCNYVYDESKEGVLFSSLPTDWRCPVCGATKDAFIRLSEVADQSQVSGEMKSVSEILVSQMAEWGVRYVFGMPGTSSLGIVDAVRKDNRLKYVQVRHEQTAAFMASAYGKLTGHVAACLTIAGPGATNLSTGLFDAKLDHSPVLALTGLVERAVMGLGTPQEIDQHSFFEPISVFNGILMSAEQATTLVMLALKHAIVEKGVSHLSIPNDVQKLPYSSKIINFEGRIPNMAVSPPEFLMKGAALAIDQACRPVIIAGFGAMGCQPALTRLSQKISAPIATTFRAKGLIDEHSALSIGCHGSIGSTAAAKLVRESDLLIVVGSSFSSLTQIPERRIVQVDLNPLMIAKRYASEVGLVGNSIEVIPRLESLVKGVEKPDYLGEIAKLKLDWLRLLSRETTNSGKPIRPPYIIKVLNEKLPSNAVISLDVGEHCWWFGRNFMMSGSQKLTFSANLGSMGSGLPGAMAASIAFPERQTICITGDGGFALVMGDFLTAVKNQMPIKVFLFNNGQLGMIMQEQKIEGYPIWQTDLQNCAYAEFAKSCGAEGIRVEDPDQLAGAVDKALDITGPVLVDILTDPRRIA